MESLKRMNAFTKSNNISKTSQSVLNDVYQNINKMDYYIWNQIQRDTLVSIPEANDDQHLHISKLLKKLYVVVMKGCK